MRPDEATSVSHADVRKAGALVGTISRDRTGTTFSYLPEYHGPAVAHTLPLDGPPVRTLGGALPPFFTGLLPEGRRLNMLRHRVKTSADDELSLLLTVGTDTVGDVTIVPTGDEPVPTAPLVTSSDLSFAELLDPNGPLDRVALPGVQDKASSAMISLPVRLDGVSAIVKLDPPEYPFATVNESFFLGMARRLRIPVAAAELIHDRSGVPGLVVQRFDRVLVQGHVRSLAVEDACQLSGRYPADKYLLTSEQVVAAVMEVCSAPLVAARNCFLQFTLAWLTGNGDLHAKNLSVLQGLDGEWRVAPMYDVPSTLPYGDRTMALPLAGRRENLTRRAFEEFGKAVGLPQRAVIGALGGVLRATQPLLGELEAGALPFNPKLTRDLVRQLRRRRADLEP